MVKIYGVVLSLLMIGAFTSPVTAAGRTADCDRCVVKAEEEAQKQENDCINAGRDWEDCEMERKNHINNECSGTCGGIVAK
jgi:hypothetical protein